MLGAGGVGVLWGFPKIEGTLLGGPCKKGYGILGSMLGSPYLEIPSFEYPKVLIFGVRVSKTPLFCVRAVSMAGGKL